MDGNKFVAKLQELKIPGSNELNGTDFDYLFFDDGTDSTCSFWKWFLTNVSPADVFSDKELCRYKELEDEKVTLSSSQLEQLESCMGMLTMFDGSNYSKESGMEENASHEQIEKLEAELEGCNHRKNFIRLEKLELQNNIYKLQEGVKCLEQQVADQKCQINSACSHLSKTTKALVTMVENIAATLKLFMDEEGKEAIFVSQLPIDKWKDEEERFTHVLASFVDKQFKEGLDHHSIHDESSDSVLLDSENGNIHLIRGPNQEEYKHTTNELNRISNMIELSEIELVDAEVELAQVEGKLEEARRVLKLIKSDSLPPISILLQDDVLKAEETIKSLEAELSTQMAYLHEQAAKAAGWERTKALAATYDVKLKRQRYFMDKVNYIEDLLLNQNCRQDFVKLLLNSDASRIDKVLKNLEEIKTSINHENVTFNERIESIKKINEREERLKDGYLSPDAANLLDVLNLNMDDTTVNQRGKLISHLENISSSVDSSESKVKSLSSYSMNILNKIHTSANQLKVCLSGSARSLPTLPLMTLDASIAEREVALVDHVYSFRQDAIHLLKEFEEKKKLLNLECSADQKLIRWVHSLSSKT